jgi:hypothetical protein
VVHAAIRGTVHAAARGTVHAAVRGTMWCMQAQGHTTWGHVSVDMSYPCHISLPSWLSVVGHGGPLRERVATSVGMEDRA